MLVVSDIEDQPLVYLADIPMAGHDITRFAHIIKRTRRDIAFVYEPVAQLVYVLAMVYVSKIDQLSDACFA